MFNLIKNSVNLLEELEKDLHVTFKQIGSENWAIDGDEAEGCPFCNHHDCFRVHYVEGENATAFYKCFSCGEYGDVTTWRSKHKDISIRDAALELARENNLKLPNDYNPVQSVFEYAALYYHNCLLETCNRPYPELGGKTPKGYQVDIRCHSEEILKRYKVGFSDGGLVSYLQGIGIDEEIIDKSGLRGKKGNDFLPNKCFIYPHFVKGKVSHFTFKDPLKKLAYQLPKAHSLNGYMFYGQDTVDKSDAIALVEGENDWLSVMESGKSPATLATIGTLSKSQLTWLKENLKNKKILTIFDPDSAGNGYREEIEKIRGSFLAVSHVVPPNGKDIDTHLSEGSDLDNIVSANLKKVEVTVSASRLGKSAEPMVASTLPVQWEVVEPPKVEAYTPPAALSQLGVPKDITEVEEIADSDGTVSQMAGCYFGTKRDKDGKIHYTRVSDFVVELKNVFRDEEGERHREIVLTRRDGYKSQPFLVNSEAKVSLKTFTVLVAKWGECEWLGREPELAGMWRLVLSKNSKPNIYVPKRIGKFRSSHAKISGWIFKNVFIKDDGTSVYPDENGIFWMDAEKITGLRPQGLEENGDPDDKYKGIPELKTTLTREETDALTQEFVNMYSLNLGNKGTTLMAMAWAWANVYSDTIFKINGGMGMLMFWGPNGDGKTTLAKWIHALFGFDNGEGYTQVGQLRTAVGWMRKAEYYSSLPMILDEVRANPETLHFLPMIRSWYDRSDRVMGVKDSFGTKTVKIRSNLFLAGEDVPEDPATKERCVILRISKLNREKLISYKWCDQNRTSLSAIGYQWIKDSHLENMDEMISGIRKIDGELVEAGCTSRISKNWAAVAFFGKKLAEKFAPEFDFMDYLTKECKIEHDSQKQNSPMIQFFEFLEGAVSQEHSKITHEHIKRENNLVHIWYSDVFTILAGLYRNTDRFNFTKMAIAKLIREQPWFVSDERKVHMGPRKARRVVLTLDWTKAPDAIRSIVGVEE